MNRFEASRLALARTGLDASESLDRALEKAVTLSSHTLDVARVGVWWGGLWAARRTGSV